MATANEETKVKVKNVETTGFSLEQVTELIKTTVESMSQAQQAQAQPILVQKDDNIMVAAEKQLRRKRESHANFVRYISTDEDDYVTYKIPKVYKRWVGDLTVGLNGAVIKIKSNGQPVRIHKSFVPLLNRKLRYIDDKVSTMLTAPDDTREMSPMQTY